MLGGCGGQCAGVELLIASLKQNVVGRRLDATTALKQQHAQREGGGEAWPLADPHVRLPRRRDANKSRQHSALS